MSESSVCCGCFINPGWMNYNNVCFDFYDQPTTNYSYKTVSASHTQEELEIMNHLAQAWEIYCQLEAQHPSDQGDFLKAIHDAQKTIAIRLARRNSPEIYFSNKNSIEK